MSYISQLEADSVVYDIKDARAAHIQTITLSSATVTETSITASCSSGDVVNIINNWTENRLGIQTSFTYNGNTFNCIGWKNTSFTEASVTYYIFTGTSIDTALNKEVFAIISVNTSLQVQILLQSGGSEAGYILVNADFPTSGTQSFTAGNIIGGYDCKVGDIAVGTNGVWGTVTAWTSGVSGTWTYGGIIGETLNHNLTLYAAAATDSPALIFQRGTLSDNYNDWRIQDRGGILYFDDRGNGSTAWSTHVQFSSTGQVTASSFNGTTGTFSGTVTASTYKGTQYRISEKSYISYDSTEDALKFTFI